MRELRISSLSAEQMDAVFRSELFCQLTDSQLAALHARFEEVGSAVARREQERKRRRLTVIGCVCAGILLIPFWAQALAATVVVAFWWFFLAALWGSLRGLWERRHR